MSRAGALIAYLALKRRGYPTEYTRDGHHPSIGRQRGMDSVTSPSQLRRAQLELLESLPIPAVVCSPDGQIVSATACFCHWSGLPSWEIKGIQLTSLVVSQDRDSVGDFFSSSPAASGDPPPADCDFVSADGSTIPVRLTVARWSRPEGEPLFLVVVREASSTLERPGETGSRQTAPTAPASTNAFLRLFNSHFRKAINQIANDIRLVAENDLPADVRALVERIDTATTGLVALTNLLIERWLIEAGEITRERIDFDLGTTLLDIERTLVQLAEQTGNSVTTDFDPALPRALRGDPTRLRQITIALGTFVMSKGRGMTIHWRCKRDTATDKAIKLSIAFEVDTAHIAPQVFQEALQEGGLQVEAAERLLEAGLGPYHARRLALLLGGDAGWETGLHMLVLWATVSLERQVQEAREVAKEQRGRALVVSGSPKEIDRWVETLRERAWDVAGATTREEALRHIRESQNTAQPFDLLVVTLVLPDGGAEQLASEVFALAGQGKIHVILVADVGRPGDAEWAREIGFSAYLVRPLSEKTLHSVLLELDRHTRAHEGNTRGIFLTRHSLADKAKPPLWILVADDDDLVCLSVSAALRQLGHHVYTAENGSQVLELCDRARFDLILMDVNMPGENGDQITVLLRSRERSSGQPPAAIIGITSDSSTENRQRCLASGMNDLIPKPLDFSVLMGILDSMKPEEAILRVWQPTRPPVPAQPAHEGEAAPNPSLASIMGMPSFESAAADRDPHEDRSEREAA